MFGDIKMMINEKAAYRDSNIKLKIAMLGYKRVPGREGGIEIVVEEPASRMVADGKNTSCTIVHGFPQSRE